MYAVQISKFGAPEDMVVLVEIPEPAPPSPGEVTVQLEYAPIHPADIMLIRGIYGKLPKLPSTLGMEGVGRVLAIGEGVDSLGIGDRVFTPIFTPCWCERLTIPAAGLFPAPDDADLPQLSMSRINPLTAHLLLTEFAPLQAGDWVIQNAANSAAGRAVIALAKARGLRTVNVVRREGLDDELTGLGGDVVLLDGADLARRVAAMTNGARVALGIDAVAGDATLAMSTCIAGGGVLVSYGAMSLKPNVVSPRQVIFNDVTIRGFWLDRWLAKTASAQVAELEKEMAGLVSSGALRAPIETTYPLTSPKDAVVNAMISKGKVLFKAA